MQILIIGAGGREHALAWKASQSPLVEHVFVAPGNAGTANAEQISNVDINVDDLDGLLDFAQSHCIDLTIVGPEAPLVAGVVDKFNAAGLRCFGPSAYCAQLEGSKTFSKEFMSAQGIPTARYESFTAIEPALAFAKTMSLPMVIKADGLAAGKGVIIAQTLQEANAAIIDMLDNKQFGAAGARLVIESFIVGEEISFICLVDGEVVKPMASSQDHKAAWDGDAGPNTGGMGAYSPALRLDDKLEHRIMLEVIEPTVRAMAEAGHPYRGFLYAGLMIDDSNNPWVMEFNCRFGDPETQPIMMRLASDLVAHCYAACEGDLQAEKLKWHEQPALAVVMAAEGYPGDAQKGHEISFADSLPAQVQVFHSGTKLEDDKVLSNGGRVLSVSAMGESIQAAQTLAYEQTARIHWQGAWYRKDIGYRAIAIENE